jgi:hypothetical protein
VPVASADSRVEADLIVGMLRSNGLMAVISADDAGGQEPHLQRLSMASPFSPQAASSCPH